MNKTRKILKNIVLKIFLGKKIRLLFGNRLKFIISGSAPCPLHVLRFFEAIGLPIYQAYGQSESVFVIAGNNKRENRIGSVGKPLTINKVHLNQENEVLIEGQGTFKYFFNSEGILQENQETLIATGDKGYFDKDGFLFLTGRKNEIFKTSTGRKVIPSKIELNFYKLHFVEHSIVHGRERPWPLVILNISNNTKEFVVKEFKNFNYLKDPHAPLAALLISKTFQTGKELTLTMKIRRKYIEEKYQKEIDHIYQDFKNKKTFEIESLNENIYWIRLK